MLRRRERERSLNLFLDWQFPLSSKTVNGNPSPSLGPWRIFFKSIDVWTHQLLFNVFEINHAVYLVFIHDARFLKLCANSYW